MQSRTPIAVLLIISVICKTTGTGVNHKPSIEPLDEVDSTTNATALERYRRLIPYMTYYLTQGVAGQQFAQPLLQGYNQYNPVNVVPNKLETPQPRPMPLVGNGYLLRPLYNPQLQAQQPQLQPQTQIQIQPQQLIQLKQLQPLGLARFANYQQPQILKNIAHLQQQSQILQNNAPLQQHLQQQQSQILQNNAPLQQHLQQQSQILQNNVPLQQLQQQQQPHYPQLPSKPFMESDFKPMIKTQPTHQYLPKQPQYLLKERRPQQVTVLQPTQLNYPKSIAASYATPKPQQNHQQAYTHLQRPVYLKAYQPHKALQQYLQEITPVTKIQTVGTNVYPVEQSVKTYTDHQVKDYTDAALRQEDHQVKDYTDAALRQLSQEDHKVKEYTDAVLRQLSQEQQQQVKETNQEEKNEEEEEQTDNSYTKYMSNNQRPNDDEVMTITQSQEIIVPQEQPQPDQSTQELTELLEGYKLSKTLPETITTANIGSSIRTLSQILKVLQRANALSAVSHPSEDSEDYATKAAALPYSSTQTEASTPGRAGVDYPNYSEIPSTAFNCKDQRYKGFFGDPETNCQVWHYCDLNGGQASFLCPNGTIFSQVALTCDWWFNVKCASTPQLYVLNERLYKYILPQRPSFPEDFAGPLVDQYLTLKYHELEAKKKNATAKAKPTTTTESVPLAPNVDFLTLLSNEVKRNV